jgi:myosin heavy subunit
MTNILREPQQIAKLKALKEKLVDTDRDDHIAIIEDWEKEIRAHLITMSLQDNPGIRKLLKKYIDDVRDIDNLLTNAKSDVLSDKQRDNLIDKKNFYLDFIDLFNGAKQSLDEIERLVDEELEEEE